MKTFDIKRQMNYNESIKRNGKYKRKGGILTCKKRALSHGDGGSSCRNYDLQDVEALKEKKQQIKKTVSLY